MKKLILFVLIILLDIPFTQAQIITTIGGNGANGYSGDGGPATAAELSNPVRIFADTKNNLFIVDNFNYLIRKVNSSGIITTVAGINAWGYSGDGGPATAAELNSPTGACLDTAGNLYISDWGNNVIRKVNTLGIITTIVGNGTGGYTGDGGPASAAELNGPSGLCIDKAGDIYVADETNNCIRKISASGNITTVAGNGTQGYSGDGGIATTAELHFPLDVCADTLGNIYIADIENHVVRKVNKHDSIFTVAGNGAGGDYGDGGLATAAQLSAPAGVCLDKMSNLYIADNGSNVIRKVSPSGIISKVAGNDTAGYSGDGGPAIFCKLYWPIGVAIDDSSNLIIADYNNNRVRKVSKPSLAGINEVVANAQDVAVYPNPSNGLFTFLIKNLELSPDSYRDKNYIEVYNVMGEKIYSTTLSTNHYPLSLNLTEKPSGIYFYRILTESGSLVGEGKLIKE